MVTFFLEKKNRPLDKALLFFNQKIQTFSFYFSMKTQSCGYLTAKALIMSTHNMFCGELRKLLILYG